MRLSLAEEFAAELLEIDTESQLKESLERASRRLGFDHFALTRLDYEKGKRMHKFAWALAVLSLAASPAAAGSSLRYNDPGFVWCNFFADMMGTGSRPYYVFCEWDHPGRQS